MTDAQAAEIIALLRKIIEMLEADASVAKWAARDTATLRRMAGRSRNPS